MSAEIKKEIQLEIAHVLFIDIVGYSKLSINDQHAAVEELNRIVRASEQFQRAEAADRLIRIPTGDGMVLVFYTNPEAPVKCAVEISRALKEHPRLQVRMGIHSGPVSGVADVNERANLAGAGINMAKRVMDCGDAGHILLSKHVAEDLEEYEKWRPFLHDLGSCEVKHAVRISVVNLYDDQFGNAKLPRKFETVQKRRTRLRLAEVAVALLVLAAIIAAFVLLLRRPARSPLAIVEKSIAVLPFENLSRDPDNAYFTEGVQEEILTRSSEVADLRGISRTSTRHYKSAPHNLRASLDFLTLISATPIHIGTPVAKQLDVAHIMEGSVQKSGNSPFLEKPTRDLVEKDANGFGLPSAEAEPTAPEPTPTTPELKPTPIPPEVEPTTIPVEPTIIPEAETAVPSVSPESAAEEASELVEPLPTVEAGGGARWHISPHIQAKVTYDDNIFIQPDHERADFIFTLAPGLTFGYWELDEQRQGFFEEKTDAYSAFTEMSGIPFLTRKARGNFLIIDYTAFLLAFARTSSENTVDHDGGVAFRWEVPKLTLGATLDAESKTEADPDVGERVSVRRLAIDITSRYQFSDETLVGLTLFNTINDPDGFIQTTEWRAEGFAQYAVTPLIQLGLGVAGGRLDVTEGSDQAFEQVLARGEYSLSDKLHAQLSGGVEFRQFDASASGRTNPVFALGVDWGPVAGTEITLQAFRRVTASALNVDENFTLTGFEATFRRELHVGLQFSVTGGYHVSSYTFISGGQPRTDDYVFLRPELLYQFTDRVQAGLTYQYRRNESNLNRFSFSNNQVTAEIMLRY
jgi:class 3 adenylate cyclase/TolB-like protein